MKKSTLRRFYFVIVAGLFVAGILVSSKAEIAAGYSTRILSVAERVDYQRRVEEVYWLHRVWNNPQPKPSLEEALPISAIRSKVEDGLRKSNALEKKFDRRVSPEQLRAEIERMARQTKNAELLSELFAALDTDSFLISEILARPFLTEAQLKDAFFTESGFEGESEKVSAEAAFEKWWQEHKNEFGTDIAGSGQEFDLPAIAPGADDTWSTMTAPPVGGTDVSAVWTGTEMIVWNGGSASGSRYNPATDMTIPVLRTNAPVSRVRHRAVWTGTEMIIWGGSSSLAPIEQFKIGGRYNPLTETWTPTSPINAPSVRTEHTDVWTGSEMIIWSGTDAVTGSYLQSGGRYNPANDTWTPTSESNAPTGRTRHTAIWTGAEMIVWGGVSGNGGVNTGGRYNPSTDTWVATSTAGAPSGRFNHSAVWTGTEMIVWGGNFSSSIFNTGGRYDPPTDSWSPTAIPALLARRLHTAVWTGTEMIVWGGCVDTQCSQSREDGSRYNPTTDTWTPTAPVTGNNRSRHAAVWTGTEMIVAGGCRGGECQNRVTNIIRYTPSSNTWREARYEPLPIPPRQPHRSVWTGTEMLVWGVDAQILDTSVYRFDPAANRWRSTFVLGAPDARSDFSIVWTGTEMIVWGGDVQGLGITSTGGRFNPLTDTWAETEINGSPSERFLHEAVWTGTEMIVWGGSDGLDTFDTGGRYNPETDTWTPTSTSGAPTERVFHTVVWTGTEMIVWGGSDLKQFNFFNTGGRYNPSTNAWTATSIVGAPSARNSHTAVWTGAEMIVWGGRADSTLFNTGGRYNASNNSWTATSITDAPGPRWIHTAVWTGEEMIVWGGIINDDFPFESTNTGGRYDPATDHWRPTSLVAAPDRRNAHTAVWTGSQMLIWGGSRDPESGYINTGSGYNVANGPTPTPTPGIGGTVTYGNAVGFPAARFVSEVTMIANGSPSVATTTNTTGQYSINGLGSGPYTVTPSKGGAVNSAITSFDAARIAQHAAGINVLTATQRTVADVSGNGSVSSFDAGQVAKFVVGVAPFGTTGSWLFSPPNRNYQSIGSVITGEDYSALLMGEVSGNWTNTGARQSGNKQFAVERASTKGITVRVPKIVTVAGSDVTIPVGVQGTAGKGIISYQFDLRYDASVLLPAAVPVDLAGTLSRNMSAVFNANERGRIRVVVYGAAPLGSGVILLKLKFTSVGAVGSESPLTWDGFMVNESDVTIFQTDGRTRLGAATSSKSETKQAGRGKF
jgi:N-acetylneuraminic acid mutarotase